MISTNRFKDGKQHIVTMSYDDGSSWDVKLMEIFNKYGIKCTFNLYTSVLDKNENSLKSKDLNTIYAGHEIACHAVHHPHLELMPITEQFNEIYQDRLKLEEATGKIVTGLAFPFGTWNEDTLQAMRAAGIEYGRTANSTHSFVFPKSFMEWYPTSHHNECERDVDQLIHNIEKAPWRVGSLLYIWGHSYEFNNQNNWDLMERICQKLYAHKDDIWFATNGEIVEYTKAKLNLKISGNGKIIYNPSAIDVWVSNDGESLKIPAGQTVKI